MFIRCCNDISNISNSFRENEEESHVFGKRMHFFYCVIISVRANIHNDSWKV